MHWYVFVENQSYGPYSDEQMRGFVAEGRVSNVSLISNTPQAGFFSATEFDAFDLWSGAAQQSMLMSAAAAGAGAVQATAANYAPIQPVKHQTQEHQVQISKQAQSYHIQQHESPQTVQAQQATQPVQSVVQHTAHPTEHPIGQHIGQATRQPIEHPIGQADIYTPAIHPEIHVPKLHNNQSCVFLVMAEIRSGGEMAFLQALQNFGHPQRVGDTVWLVRTLHSVEQVRNTLSQTLNQQDRLFILNSKSGKPAWFNIGTELDHRIREMWDEGTH